MAHYDAFFDSSSQFQFRFLGKSIVLNSNATGFASLQMPLQIAYFQHIRQRRQGSSQTLCIRQDSLLIQSADGQEEVHSYSDIGFTDFIRFEIFADKKRQYGIFLCQSNDSDRSTSGDAVLLNPTVPLHEAVISYRHQPMVVCILRRSHGLRALESHLFAANNELNAVSCVLEIQHMIESHRKQKSFRLYQYLSTKEVGEAINERETFRYVIHNLSKSQNLRPIEHNKMTQSIENPSKSMSKSVMVLTRTSSENETSVPKPKPRRSKLTQRTESVNLLERKISCKTNNLNRTKSLGYLSKKSRTRVYDSDSENEIDSQKMEPDNEISSSSTYLSSEHRDSNRPVARVRPRIESTSNEDKDSDHNVYDIGEHRHMISNRDTYTLNKMEHENENCEDVSMTSRHFQQLRLSKSHDDFQKTSVYFADC